MSYDRNDVLSRTRLPDLCDEILGPRRGRGPSANWPCPDPGHGPQTGQTPPVTVFQTRGGTERWRCHACGAGGTAVDLVMRTDGIGFREALDRLGQRVGAPEAPLAQVIPLRPPQQARLTKEASPAIDAYVSSCEAWLWGPGGRAFRRFLHARGLADEVLRANRVGADPGPRAIPRADGLPRGGPAVVLPLLEESGRAVYLQARYLQPRSRKYDNPASRLVPASPRLGEVRLPGPAARADVALVCEGIPDALIAAQARWRSVAVLGAGLPDERVAQAVTERFPTETLVLAFDADHRGVAGAEHLSQLLDEAGAGARTVNLAVPDGAGDINAWAVASGDQFEADLDRAVSAAVAPVDHDRNPPALELDDLLETLAYRHLLAAEPTDVNRTIDQITAAIGSWITGDSPTASATPGTAAELLEQITYHHVLPGDPGSAVRVADRTAEILSPWLDGLSGAEAPGASLGW